MENKLPGSVLIHFDGHELFTYPHACWYLRDENIKNIVNLAFSWISKKGIAKMKPFTKHFGAWDHGNGEYTMCSDKYDERMIPCFSFDHWKECKIEDYESVCESISKEGEQPYKYDTLLWIGQLSHSTRTLFVEKFHNHPKMKIIPLRDHWGHDLKSNDPYISLPEHCQYKYLIDLQGNGYSARVKFLMHSKRPLFYQNRHLHEYWFWDLKQYVHYIPVKEDLSDFETVFDWAENNQEKVKEIAENAYEFAKNNLKREDAISRMKHILYKLGTGELI
jgi:hypothetical protein